jgi:hypothetical protein
VIPEVEAVGSLTHAAAAANARLLIGLYHKMERMKVNPWVCFNE